MFKKLKYRDINHKNQSKKESFQQKKKIRFPRRESDTRYLGIVICFEEMNPQRDVLPLNYKGYFILFLFF